MRAESDDSSLVRTSVAKKRKNCSTAALKEEREWGATVSAKRRLQVSGLICVPRDARRRRRRSPSESGSREGSGAWTHASRLASRAAAADRQRESLTPSRSPEHVSLEGNKPFAGPIDIHKRMLGSESSLLQSELTDDETQLLHNCNRAKSVCLTPTPAGESLAPRLFPRLATPSQYRYPHQRSGIKSWKTLITSRLASSGGSSAAAADAEVQLVEMPIVPDPIA